MYITFPRWPQCHTWVGRRKAALNPLLSNSWASLGTPRVDTLRAWTSLHPLPKFLGAVSHLLDMTGHSRKRRSPRVWLRNSKHQTDEKTCHVWSIPERTFRIKGQIQLYPQMLFYRYLLANQYKGYRLTTAEAALFVFGFCSSHPA